MGVSIRHATPSDAPVVRAFVVATLWAHGLDADHDDLATFGVPFNGALAELVAVDADDSPIGIVTLWPREKKAGWIAKLFVDPERRGEGIAHALLDAVADEARRWRLTRVGLSTVPILRDAIRLYESYGFRRRGRRLEFWLDLRQPSRI